MNSSRLTRTVALAAACAMAVCLSACSSDGAGTGSDGDEAAAMRASDEQVSTAMVVMQDGASVLFVDQQTQTPYYPALPEGAVLGLDGQPIADGDLAVGNIVEVTGNGIMLESYPGQYPGIYKVQVIETGSPADADRYADLVESVGSGVAADPNEVPSGSLDYRTDLAVVTSLLEAYNSDFATESLTIGSGSAVDAAEGDPQSSVAVMAGTPFAEDGTLLAGILDARVQERTDATLSFLTPPLSVEVSRCELTKTDSGQPAVDRTRLQATSQTVETSASDIAPGAVAFAIEPGYFYFVTASFEAGTADYGFACLTPGTN